jgi:hypothetical protein
MVLERKVADVGVQDVLLDDGTTVPIIRVAREGGVVLLGIRCLHQAFVQQLVPYKSFR